MSGLTRRIVSLILTIALMFSFAFAEDEIALDETYSEAVVQDGFVELKPGDRDEEEASAVLSLQNRLRTLGYFSDTPDGVYGSDTEFSVADFQYNNGLPRTGVADSQTLSLLYDEENAKPAVGVNTESDIYRVQKMLSLWGFLEGELDGRQGSDTNAAIIRFKDYLQSIYYKRNPLPTSEPVDTPVPELSGFNDAEIAQDVPLNAVDLGNDATIDLEVISFVDEIYPFNPYGQTVSNGDDNEEVGRIQRRLHQLKYLAIVNGKFDAATTRALLYFQKLNSLEQNGVADEATQRRLFSDAAVPSEEYVNPYKIYVDISDQMVYVFQWDGNGYGIALKKFVCSTGLKGKETETPIGTFSSVGPTGTGEWYYFKKYNCYAKWATIIVGGIFFHSVTYNKKKQLINGSVSNLGRRASHGCIRLEIPNAKWIYQNCPPGTTVVIQE